MPIESNRTLLPDTYRYQAWRNQMVVQLRQRGIEDQRILDAINKLPRHWFCNDTLLDSILYDIDKAVPIDCDQTLSRPYTVAWQTQLLKLEPFMTVFEIGTGTGYQTAVLCEMGARVYTMERQRKLFNDTKYFLTRLMNYPVRCFWGDSFNGIPEMKGFKYDRILVTCGVAEFPDSLMDQLKIGGIMVLPLGTKEQKMVRVFKDGDDPSSWRKEILGDANFVPMLRGRNR